MLGKWTEHLAGGHERMSFWVVGWMDISGKVSHFSRTISRGQLSKFGKTVTIARLVQIAF